MSQNADIIIIGGGVIGCSTAYNLARLGAGRVLLSISVGLILGASVAVWTARERQLFDFFKGR